MLNLFCIIIAIKLVTMVMVFTGLATIEAYNAKANEWFHINPMNTRRSSVGVGVVGSE